MSHGNSLKIVLHTYSLGRSNKASLRVVYMLYYPSSSKVQCNFKLYCLIFKAMNLFVNLIKFFLHHLLITSSHSHDTFFPSLHQVFNLRSFFNGTFFHTNLNIHIHFSMFIDHPYPSVHGCLQSLRHFFRDFFFFLRRRFGTLR